MLLQNQTQNGVNISTSNVEELLNVCFIEKDWNIGGCLAGLASIGLSGKDATVLVQEISWDVRASAILSKLETLVKRKICQLVS